MTYDPFHGLSRDERDVVMREGVMPFLHAARETESPATGGGFLAGICGLAVFAGLVYGAIQLLIA